MRRTAVGLVALALGACQVSGRGAAPPVAPVVEAPAASSRWSPAAADLLFMSGRDGNAEIYLLPAGGSEWVNLTNHPAGDNWPEWSPDGSRIAFQSRRSGNLDVWVMNADGSDPVQLTDHPEPDYLPAWSSDGSRIVFTSWRTEEGDPERSAHVYVMNADGSGERRLVREALGTSAGASWSPDGRAIVYGRAAGEDAAVLVVADADGGNERPLTTADGAYHGSAVFSPDGSRIAFYSARDEVSELVVVDAGGGNRRVVLSAGTNWYPRWSPDGRWLTFTAPVAGGAEGDLDVYAIEIDGAGEPVRLVGGPGREAEGRWRN